MNPELLEHQHLVTYDGAGSKTTVAASPLFPQDVWVRAKKYLSAFPHMGAYSHSKGVHVFRREIADWFTKRDSIDCDPESIFLTDGASSAIRQCIEIISTSPDDGILIPIPQYPLYSATITRYRSQAVGYYLDELNGWALNTAEVKRAISQAKSKGINTKAICVINPGNPTGSIFDKDDIVNIIALCEQENLVILADEVYQENIYNDEKQFVSFRRMVHEMKSPVKLISFHSSSKGLSGECGVRGGLMQLENVGKVAVTLLYKLNCVTLCSNTLGQAMLSCILNPPHTGEPSYKLWHSERQSVYDSLKRKAKYTTVKLNQMQGVSCQPIEGAMYAFPKLTLPLRAIEAAKAKGVEPDMLYCLEMLEETGVMSVPGSGFGQKSGTWHYRITILPEEKMFTTMLDSIHQFHDKFLEKYSDSSVEVDEEIVAN